MKSGSSLVHATVILFIGCLAVCAKGNYISSLPSCALIVIFMEHNTLIYAYWRTCLILNAIGRPVAEHSELGELLYFEGHGDASADATAANTTFVGESKLTLKFCSPYLGCHFKNGNYMGSCWCCTMPDGVCSKTKQECWDTCPACDPKCHPHGSAHEQAVKLHAWMILFFTRTRTRAAFD
jgi:hypothetical protein